MLQACACFHMSNHILVNLVCHCPSGLSLKLFYYHLKFLSTQYNKTITNINTLTAPWWFSFVYNGAGSRVRTDDILVGNETFYHWIIPALYLVPQAGVEPTLANYLLHTGYKSAVLPLNYRGTDTLVTWIQVAFPSSRDRNTFRPKCMIKHILGSS